MSDLSYRAFANLDVYRCSRGHDLSFEPSERGLVMCHCADCERPHPVWGVTYLRGHGRTIYESWNNWRHNEQYLE